MLAHLRAGGIRAVVVGKDAQSPSRFYIFSVHQAHSRFEIGVISSGLGSVPAVILLGNGKRALVAHDKSLTWIDTVAASSTKTSELYGVFFEFLTIGSDEEIVVVHEVGAVRVNKDGAELWSVHTDVVADGSLDEAGNLVLTLMDQDAKVHVEMSSGRVTKPR
jgi:hypothetical protein